MVLNVLSKSFQLLNRFKIEIKCTYYSTQKVKELRNVTPILLQDKISLPKLVSNHIIFKPKYEQLQYPLERSKLPWCQIIECPTISNLNQIDNPLKNNIEQIDIVPNKIIEIPTNNNVFEKQAARLLIIRKKKMKKHKRRKFLKRMKNTLYKKEIRKQQVRKDRFEAELRAMSLEAERFDPKKYVEERLELLTRECLPNKWRGESLPEDVIKKFIDEKEAKKDYKRKLHTYRLKVK